MVADEDICTNGLKTGDTTVSSVGKTTLTHPPAGIGFPSLKKKL
jgi:hypothetical protein